MTIFQNRLPLWTISLALEPADFYFKTKMAGNKTMSRIMTLNSPGGSTLQCGRDDMQLNSPRRPPYWNSTSRFDFDHITAVDMSFCTSLRNFIQIGPPSAEKNDVMSISRRRISAIVDFRGPIMGSLKSPCMTCYRSSKETIALNCLVFEIIAFFAFWRQDPRWRILGVQ